MTPEGDRTDAERLARLEAEMAILRAEFAKLRERVGVKGTPPPRSTQEPIRSRDGQPLPKAHAGTPPKPASQQPIFPAFPELTPDSGKAVENMIGRYVVIVAATITLLVGVGVFMRWAIDHGFLGPAARVVLGYLGALALAIGGIRLRMRGTREFGNILLAIALGIAHLVCWTAGPLLHVMPSAAALAIGAAASVVLAEFALRHDEQALCALGFGGAAIAPFVTTDDEGNLIALAVYGIVVIALSVAALRDRPWRTALNVTLLSFALYLVVAVVGEHSASAWPWVVIRLGLLFPIALLLLLIPFAHSRYRRLLLRVAGGGVIFGALLRLDKGQDLPSLLLVVGAAIMTIGALDLFRLGALEREDLEVEDPLVTGRNAFFDALVLPLGFLAAALAATPGVYSTQAAIVCAIWAVLGVLMTHRTRGQPESEKYATTATIAAVWLIPAALSDHWIGRVAGAIAMGLLLLGVAQQIPAVPFVVGSAVSLVMASAWSLMLLDTRPAYEYVPLGTVPSIVAIVVIGGWLAALRFTHRSDFLPAADAWTRKAMGIAMSAGAVAMAFFWGRAELAAAWSPTASTALVIVYYAACGAMMIWFGRQRDVQALRVIGLALALLAAGKAVLEALVLPNIAVRIAVFFAVSAFLLAVAYWYRRGGDDEPEPAPATG